MVYSQEALAAVGLGLSPTHAVVSPGNRNYRPFASAHAGLSTDVLIRYTVTIVRAWGLAEMLGGTNAYIIASWGCGSRCKASARTAAVPNSTQPQFNASLVLDERWPAVHSLEDEMAEKVLVLRVFNQNPSLSDDLLGCAEVSVESLLGGTNDISRGQELRSTLQVAYLNDQRNHTAGCLEIALSRVVQPAS